MHLSNLVELVYTHCPPKAGFPVAVTAASSKQAKVYVCMYVYVRGEIKDSDFWRSGSDGPGVAGLNNTILKNRVCGSSLDRGI